VYLIGSFTSSIIGSGFFVTSTLTLGSYILLGALGSLLAVGTPPNNQSIFVFFLTSSTFFSSSFISTTGFTSG